MLVDHRDSANRYLGRKIRDFVRHDTWWEKSSDALRDAEEVAAWLYFHIERRSAEDTRSSKPVERLTLTVVEAAGSLGISRAFAYEAFFRGEFPCIRIGRRVLISKIALEKMLEPT